MARPKKEGLDYFSVDVDWDDSCKGIETEFKNDGTKWIIEFWKAAYRKRIGEIQLDGIHGGLFAKICNIDVERHQKILDVALAIGFCFRTSDGLYTSNGIQKRISAVSADRAAAVQRSKERKEAKERNKYKVKEITEKLPNNSRITHEQPNCSPEKPQENDIFTELRKKMQESFNDGSYTTWFEETLFTKTENEITIYVKNNFSLEYIKEKYLLKIKELMQQISLNHDNLSIKIFNHEN